MADEVEKAAKTAGQGIKEAAQPILKSLLPTAFQGAVESLQAKASDERQNRMYKENQRMLFDLAQESQRNAASNQVEGLRRAGLSTAQAAGAQGMGVAAASAPHGSAHAGAANPEMALIKNQSALLKSEADLNDARREGVEIDNANKEGENLTYASAYDEILDVIEQDAVVAKDSVTLNVVNALRQNKNIFRTAGDIKALKDVAQMVQSSPAIMAQRIHNALNTAIDTAAANNPNWVAAQIVRPLLENSEIRERMSLLAANTAKFMSDVENNRALLPKIKEETEWLGAQIRNLDIDTEKVHNSDIVGAIKNGDWSTVGAHAAVGLADAAADAGKAYFAAKGGAKGFVEGKSAVEQRAQQNASPSKSASPRNRLDWEHPLKAKPGKSPKAGSDAATMKKWYGTRGEVPQMSVMNGKPYYKDANGNWHRVTKPKH